MGCSNYFAVLQVDSIEEEAPRRKTCLRVQFFADIGMHTDDVMAVTGSIPELTDWGAGHRMRKSATSYQYDVDLEVEEGSTEIISFQYGYYLSKGDRRVWESKPSRCKLHLSKILKGVGVEQTVRVIFQATGFEDYDNDLLITGTDESLGKLDLKNALAMIRTSTGKYQHHVLVKPSSLRFWFMLVRKSAILLLDEPTDEEPEMLWTSGMGTVKYASPLVVVHLLDKWDVVYRSDPPWCKICMDTETQALFTPCGHAATCWECGWKMESCPICRASIKEQTRIYL